MQIKTCKFCVCSTMFLLCFAVTIWKTAVKSNPLFRLVKQNALEYIWYYALSSELYYSSFIIQENILKKFHLAPFKDFILDNISWQYFQEFLDKIYFQYYLTIYILDNISLLSWGLSLLEFLKQPCSVRKARKLLVCHPAG